MENPGRDKIWVENRMEIKKFCPGWDGMNSFDSRFYPYLVPNGTKLKSR